MVFMIFVFLTGYSVKMMKNEEKAYQITLIRRDILELKIIEELSPNSDLRLNEKAHEGLSEADTGR